MQGRELRGQPVGHTARVAGAAPRRNRVLIPVAEPRIEERARAVHLGRANVRVPVGDRAEPSPRVQVDAREAEGRWEKRSGLLPIRPERLPVLVKLCVEAARPPAREHCFDRREIDAQEIGEGFEVRRERHDGADVQVAVRPAVEAPADAGGERVVDGRVTESALEADRSDAAARVEEARHPHDRIQLEERQGRRGVVEVYFTCLELNAVVGVTGFFDARGSIRSIGLQCAFCHSTVDDALAPGIGRRLDGWANRDLNVGAIVSLAPNLKPFTDLLGVDLATVKAVLASWGPGRFDAELDKDGKALRPDGKQAGTLLPPAFGLAGVNLHTWTGFGSVTYWNAYVGATEMHGSGTFFDARLSNGDQYPLAARSGSGNTRGVPDRLTAKLAALHFYQLSIPAPKALVGSFSAAAASRGKALFDGRARCASCHVPPLFTEPGNNLHAPAEIGVDAFQADRSPTHMYRTAPLAGLWTHQKGGFYHDGRFATLLDVVAHYDTFFKLSLSDQEKKDLVEYLKGL